MFILPNLDLDCPICAKQLVWVDNGYKMQYYYCRQCKKELEVLEKESFETQAKNDIATDMHDDDGYGGPWYY